MPAATNGNNGGHGNDDQRPGTTNFTSSPTAVTFTVSSVSVVGLVNVTAVGLLVKFVVPDGTFVIVAVATLLPFVAAPMSTLYVQLSVPPPARLAGSPPVQLTVAFVAA